MAGGRRGTAARTARPPAPPTGGGLLGQQQQGEEGGVAGTQYPQVGFSGFSEFDCDIIRYSMTVQAVPIPDIPHDSSLTFELIMFAYVAAALGLQYLNLYR